MAQVGECLYLSRTSGIYYGVFKRAGKQIKRSLKTADKKLAKRRLEDLRQRVARLNTKAVGNILFTDLTERWFDFASSTMKPNSVHRRRSAINRIKPHFPNTVRSIS